MDTTFAGWAEQVVETLYASGDDNVELFAEACSRHAETHGLMQGNGSVALLTWLRGTEPQEHFQAGEPPEDYARFLLNVWTLTT